MRSTLPYLATKEDSTDFAGRGFYLRQQREFDRSANAKIETTIGRLLASDRIEPERIAELASPLQYACAVKSLIREAKIDDATFAILLKPPATARVAAFRAARTFGVITRDDEALPMTLEILRGLKCEAAFCAVASLGEIAWPRASRRVRAVFCLCALIGIRRS